jgi:hypothetical protein
MSTEYYFYDNLKKALIRKGKLNLSKHLIKFLLLPIKPSIDIYQF